ncbi:MAG: hybrid sensor histidine kinase/response regulator [Anaerolineae bacterium]|nr:hybrid sensor histidine kinase/response regulator [Anaerolineae bacterium]
MTTILIVDDEAKIRTLVTAYLEAEGFTVYSADDGQGALLMFRRYRPALIVLDIMLPEIDGLDVLRHIRRESEAYVLLLTAKSDEVDRVIGLSIGADDYLTKPFRRTDLLQAIQTRLSKHNEQQVKHGEQYEAINEAFQAEREKRLLTSRIVAMFSHDFRNPLASILSSSELLKRYEDRLSPERKRHHLDRIGGSVHLLIQMLDEMLAVAEMEHGKLSPQPQSVDIAAFVEDIVEEFRLIHGDQYGFTLKDTFSGIIETDPRLLRQILVNLISNAVKYSPRGSMVTIHLEGSGSGLEFSVIDQGMGMTEEEQARIFEAFYRADNAKNIKGTGLGLTIVMESVQLCGGEIKVTSTVGHGSNFVVKLPLNG